MSSSIHVLVVNDDGPPSRRYSPYIRPFVDALQDAGHRVSVVVPATSRSWIGKAHLIGALLEASFVPPDAFREDGSWETAVDPDPPTPISMDSNGGQKPRPRAGREEETDWVVVRDGTPASCTQLGLFHLFPERGRVDLVVSGPNHGHNTSTIYNLSSGTVGGALEAVTCGKRGIALSFGSKEEQDPEVVGAASRLAVRVIEHLGRNWDSGVELYNVNVPLRPDVERRSVRYARSLPNVWTKGSLYAERPTLDPGEKDGPGGAAGPAQGYGWLSWIGSTTEEPRRAPSRERYFQWSTELSDIQKSLESSEDGTDAHTLRDGCTSVTPLRANFWHPSGFSGEIKLGSK
jgi:5'/3'-nucleotidase SurE